ncbi:MAG: LysR family transcriptional regulator, partial [Alphaproteobacteria bacterium]|nr:LysR family transcriptional regulator [Alphaproteobacteria bacterium]
VMPLFAAQRLMPRLGDLRQKYPHLHLDIDTAAHATTRLGDGIDVAIVLAKEIDPLLYAKCLDHDRIFVLGAKTLKVNGVPVTRPEQLSEATIILHRELPETFDAWRQAAGLPDLDPAATDFYDSAPLMLEAAAQGLGIAFVHENHLEGTQDARLQRLFDFDVPSPYSYWFVCRQRALDARPVRLFHDWLLKPPAKP